MHFIYRWLLNLFQFLEELFMIDTTSARATATNAVSKSQFEQNREANMQKAMVAVDKGESILTTAIKFNIYIPHSTLMQRQSKNGFKAWASQLFNH